MAEGSLITDELKKMVGVPSESVIFKIEKGAIQRYAQSIGDPNPLFDDADYARKSKFLRDVYVNCNCIGLNCRNDM